MKNNTENRLNDVKYIARLMAELPKEHQWLVRYVFCSGSSFGLSWARDAVDDAAFLQAIAILKGEGDNE